MTDTIKLPLVIKMNGLCQEIEKLPASEQQTAISVKASELAREVGALERELDIALQRGGLPSTIVDAIIQERNYQDEKYGTLDVHGHTVGEWLLVMERKLADAKRGWLNNSDEALQEILQVVAVGVAAMQQHRVVTRYDDFLPF